MLFSIVPLSVTCFSFSLPLVTDARDFRECRVRLSFSPRGVPTTQTDKGNPENGTGDAVFSGKKVGPQLTAENAPGGELPSLF